MRRTPERHLLIMAPPSRCAVPTLTVTEGLAVRCVWSETLWDAIDEVKWRPVDLVLRALPFTCGRLETHFVHVLRAQSDPDIVILLRDAASRSLFDPVWRVELCKSTRITFLEEANPSARSLDDCIRLMVRAFGMRRGARDIRTGDGDESSPLPFSVDLRGRKSRGSSSTSEISDGARSSAAFQVATRP